MISWYRREPAELGSKNVSRRKTFKQLPTKFLPCKKIEPLLRIGESVVLRSFRRLYHVFPDKGLRDRSRQIVNIRPCPFCQATHSGIDLSLIAALRSAIDTVLNLYASVFVHGFSQPFGRSRGNVVRVR